MKTKQLVAECEQDYKESVTLGAGEMSDEVYRIVEATNDDGTVDVTIEDVVRNDKTAVVVFSTPTAEVEKEKMDWPTRDSDDYKLVRICRATVGGFAAISDLKGERIAADPETWEIATETTAKQNAPLRKKGRYIGWGLAKTVGIVLAAGMTLASILALIIPPILLLLLPFGITYLTFFQGLSLMIVGGIALSIIGAALDDE